MEHIDSSDSQIYDFETIISLTPPDGFLKFTSDSICNLNEQEFSGVLFRTKFETLSPGFVQLFFTKSGSGTSIPFGIFIYDKTNNTSLNPMPANPNAFFLNHDRKYDLHFDETKRERIREEEREKRQRISEELIVDYARYHEEEEDEEM
ncbi:17128_t:CDS:2 [Dentiscutata heterogama]|uniref:17128_t:CDS:1 n=1 Tax=Dentiscutata heterogama TaxID=1316150 RepID=A0ACA9MDC2_9GLOM|nr:17128_t:CDS:2 [Dentiscutata heterogama]